MMPATASMSSLTCLANAGNGSGRTYLEKGQAASSLTTTSIVEKWNSLGASVFSEVSSYEVKARQYEPALASMRSLRYIVSIYDLHSSVEISTGVNKSLDDIYTMDAAASIDPDISRYAVRKSIDVVEDYIDAGDLYSLNELLERARPEMLRRVTAVALLRTAYRVRGKLSKWMRFYTELFAHLEATHQDPHRALKGLIRSRV